MKTKLGFVAAACLALLVSACSSGSRDLIVGKWEAGEGNVKLTAEFSKNATAKITIFGKTLQGTYKLNSDDELEWTLNGITTKAKMRVSQTELELTATDGKTIKYKRV